MENQKPHPKLTQGSSLKMTKNKNGENRFRLEFWN